mmetsp:Transcript_83746/g.132743  ORF Transcript_83746/g.132743 Transcript_83746/m.132743 type:complete len:155 (+) Transcript_83746:32-496(+)
MVKKTLHTDVFALPKRKKPKRNRPGESEYNRKKKEEIRQREAEAKAEKERKKAEAVAKHTGKKASQRAARRQKRLKEGKMQQTDKDLAELLQTKDDVVCALEDVQDEAELRKKFPSEGTAGYGSEYFSSSRYKFRYLLSKDGTPVAQIYKWPWP